MHGNAENFRVGEADRPSAAWGVLADLTVIQSVVR